MTAHQTPAPSAPTEDDPLVHAGRAAWAVLGILGVIVVIGYVLSLVPIIVVPLILALFPATLLVPLAAFLCRRGVPAGLASFVSIIAGLVLVGGLIGAMVPLVAGELPALTDSAAEGVAEIEEWLEGDPLGVGVAGFTDILEAARAQLGEIGDYAPEALTAASTAVETLVGILLVFVLLFFYLKDGRGLAQGLIGLAPTRQRARVGRIAEASWDTLGSYFRGQLLVALADAVLIGIGLLVVGIPLALPLAVLIFFGALFPVVGAVITGSLAVLVAFADGGLTSALIVLAIVLVVQQLEGNVLQPMILSRAIDLHPVVVLLSVAAGSVLLGILGAFLAVPTAAVIVGAFRALRDDEQGQGADLAPSGATG